jgi:23S rRNA (adenine2030-N6)-methyltransferase
MALSMKYQHIFHAGNFADVAKHLALVYCLTALKRKDTPFFVLDSHAGRGKYDLHCEAARRGGEASGGILKLLQLAAPAPELQDYLAAVGSENAAHYQHYPGSAALIAAALRHADRAAFVELEPTAAR